MKKTQDELVAEMMAGYGTLDTTELHAKLATLNGIPRRTWKKMAGNMTRK